MQFSKIFAGANQNRGAVDFIVAGLGNPGRKYENTRHNAGFLAIEYICNELDFRLDRSKYNALFAQKTVEGKKLLFLDPQTFMNNSGQSIVQAMNFYKLKPQQLIVLCDDISLAPGKLRIRRSGSAGTHNGLRSIVDCMGSQDFVRIKIGVGERPNPQYDLADWVLSSFTSAERKALEEVFSAVLDSVKLISQGKIDQAMNLYNS